MGKAQKKTTFWSISPSDVPGLEEWARLRCCGNSVEKLASAHGIEESLDVVAGYLARGLPADSKAAVERVCREELSSTADPGLPTADSWTVKEIDQTDRAGLMAWAHGICKGLDIVEAAKALNVEPTPKAVVAALADSLPTAIRTEVEEACFAALEEEQRLGGDV